MKFLVADDDFLCQPVPASRFKIAPHCEAFVRNVQVQKETLVPTLLAEFYSTLALRACYYQNTLTPGVRTSRKLAFRPAVESVLRSPTIDKDEAQLRRSDTTRRRVLRPSRRARDAFLRLRAVEALGHRQFRLIWYGQIFTAMATWMDQVARGWLIYELLMGGILVGALSSVIGAEWAVAAMGAAGAVSMVAIYIALPRARHIR